MSESSDDEVAVCFICKSSNENVTLFKPEAFEKCKASLMIRKACNLKDKDKKLPEEIDKCTGYHVARMNMKHLMRMNNTKHITQIYCISLFLINYIGPNFS